MFTLSISLNWRWQMIAHIINSFTTNDRGGNPAGVVVDFDHKLTEAQMQAIAQEMALSETAFIRNGTKDADYDIRFFTPTEEVDLCGHATIASFWFLKTRRYLSGNCSSQLTKAGHLAIDIKHGKDGAPLIMMEQSAPKRIPISDYSSIDITKVFPNAILSEELPLEIWSTGLKDLLVPITSRTALNQLQVDFDALTRLSEALDVIGAHAFAVEDGKVFARNFAPRFGIDEESATGTSNGALTAYLRRHLYTDHAELSLEILQGESMGLISSIFTHLRQSSGVDSIWVGGYCTYMKEIDIKL